MATNKVRANLYMDKDIWESFRAVVADMPNQSASGFIEDWLRLTLPTMQELTVASKAGDREALIRMGYLKLGENLDVGSKALYALRTDLDEGGETTAAE
jgi:hypothetical protein